MRLEAIAAMLGHRSLDMDRVTPQTRLKLPEHGGRFSPQSMALPGSLWVMA